MKIEFIYVIIGMILMIGIGAGVFGIILFEYLSVTLPRGQAEHQYWYVGALVVLLGLSIGIAIALLPGGTSLIRP